MGAFSRNWFDCIKGMMCFSCLALWAAENSFSLKRFRTDTAELYSPIREVGEDLTVGKIILFITTTLGAQITAVLAAGPSDFQSPATAILRDESLFVFHRVHISL